MAKFFDTNLNITKSRISNGDIVELEINNKPVELKINGLPLFCWKHSSSYIYTKTLPLGEGTIAVITESPLTKANGTYVDITKTDVWTVGEDFYKSNLDSTTEPKGESGTPVDIGDIYIGTSGDTYLTEGTWYTKSDDKWYEVDGLKKNGLTLGDEVTDDDEVTELESETLSEVDYVEYTYEAHITVSSTDYTRYSAKDIIL